MARNKTQLHRQKFIDSLLRINGDGFTKDEILNKVRREFDLGINELNEKTIERDLKELGDYDEDEKKYNLLQKSKRNYQTFYKYENTNYSAFEMLVEESEIAILNLAYKSLVQKKMGSIAEEFYPILYKLQRRNIKAEEIQKDAPIIFDYSPESEGTKHIEDLLDGISNSNILQIGYKSFVKTEEQTFIFQPSFLKEYNRRWFVFGFIKGEIINNEFKANTETYIINFALDRIIKRIKIYTKISFQNIDTSIAINRLQNSIGVSFQKDSVQTIIKFSIKKERAPYIVSKKIHVSQEFIKLDKNGNSIFKINIYPNYEMYVKFLEYAADLAIISPATVRSSYQSILQSALSINA